MGLSSFDSLQRVVAGHDSLLADLRHHIVQVTASPPSVYLLSSPLLQTLFGGLLAVGAGIATEAFREWRSGYRLRRRLAQEIELVSSLLTKLRAELENLTDGVQRVAGEVREASDGYTIIAEEVETELAPQLVHDIQQWYHAVGWALQGVLGSLGSVDMVRRHTSQEEKEMQDQVDAVKARVKEMNLLLGQANGILGRLRAIP